MTSAKFRHSLQQPGAGSLRIVRMYWLVALRRPLSALSFVFTASVHSQACCSCKLPASQKPGSCGAVPGPHLHTSTQERVMSRGLCSVKHVPNTVGNLKGKQIATALIPRERNWAGKLLPSDSSLRPDLLCFNEGQIRSGSLRPANALSKKTLPGGEEGKKVILGVCKAVTPHVARLPHPP